MDSTLLTFPCEFPIKVIGNHHQQFLIDIKNIIIKHYPNTAESAITHKLSAEDRFVAISVTLTAKDQATLDELYRELTQHADVKMVL